MVADFNDAASDQEEADRQAMLEAQKAHRERAPNWWDGKTCINPDCEEEVEPERIAVGCFRCFDCQTRNENLIKRGLK